MDTSPEEQFPRRVAVFRAELGALTPLQRASVCHELLKSLRQVRPQAISEACETHSQAEVAAALGISQQAVSKAIRRLHI